MTYEQHVNRRVALQLSLEEAQAVRRRVDGFSGNNNLLESERVALERCMRALDAITDRLQRQLDETEGA